MAERWKRMVRPSLWALGVLVAAFLVVFALVVGPWLLTRYPQKGLTSEQALKAKNDVRTTLVQALAGLAVAGGLAVTYSTYRQNQRDQAARREEQDRLYQLSQAEQAARREEQDRAHQLNMATHVNDLYTKAVEQLGHNQAPVRLGALYSLVHLAQANPQQRPTVVDVLCAYLRMPYTPPRPDEPAVESTAATTEDPMPDPSSEQRDRDAAQELQVRLTAQRLLGDHLHVPSGVSGKDAQELLPSPDETFWPGISLDLTGATLINLSLDKASVVDARFARATFSGTARFREATFIGGGLFDDGTFIGDASFHQATFTGRASFEKATFTGEATFHQATFGGDAWFQEATFTHLAWFHQATFTSLAAFGGTTFAGDASFSEATFAVDAWFGVATFSGTAWFDKATFAGAARFCNARFTGSASFKETTFSRETLFGLRDSRHAYLGVATFTREAWFDKATFAGDTSVPRGDLRRPHLVPRGDLRRRRLIRKGDLQPGGLVR